MPETGESIGRLRRAAAFASGPAYVMDFLLPLWAAKDLGAKPGVIGAIVAIESVASLLMRPLVGVLADRSDRRLVGALGAGLYVAAFIVYALAPTIEVVGVGAAIGGAGGALFWVALRADVGTRLDDDPVAYAHLLASEERGALLAFVIALSTLGAIGYRPLFLVGALACTVALLLLLAERRADPLTASPKQNSIGLRSVGRRLAPLLLITALTTGAETGLALLLLLHLQARYGLQPQSIALLFLPGSIVLSILPAHAFRVACRVGRTRAIVTSLLASAAFAMLLALAAHPIIVAALWTLCATCIAGALPVEQTTVAQASRGALGQGVGLYQTAALGGAIIAPPTLGALYATAGWPTACVAAGSALLLGAALAPIALATLKLPNLLSSTQPQERG